MAGGGGGGAVRRSSRSSGAGLLGWRSCWLPLLVGLMSVSGEETQLVETWLKTYGYLLPLDQRQQSDLQSAVASMQRFYGLPASGVLDQTTVEWMRRPRCGVPDRPASRWRQRRRRYALTGQRWRDKKVSYSISNYTPKVGHKDTHRAIRRAFNIWQAVTPLSFQEVPYSEVKLQGKEADIMIFFASGFHGDSSPFDGEGGFLAHAYFPGAGIGGDTHFDLDEPWTLADAHHNGNDLFLVAVHELGHALGLEHSSDPAAIMAPFYQHMDTQSFSLPLDDLQGIQKIYGVPTPMLEPTRPLPTLPPRRHQGGATATSERKRLLAGTGEPDICDGNFNTVAVLRREMFVFKDGWFWRLRGQQVQEGYPMQIQLFWKGLPSRIDAAYERPDGRFVFFTGDQYWLFREVWAEPGYPRSVRELGATLPLDGIQAALRWEPLAKTYFFRGALYWRYSEERRTVDPGYPKPIAVWNGTPHGLQGAFISRQGDYTYFYKGRDYWKFDNQRLAVLPGYPQSILRDWMGCVPPEASGGRRTPLEEVDITVALDQVGSKVNALAVVLPCVLALCILVLLYTICQFHNKGALQDAATQHCYKYPVQEWV
ncbi:matrix metalloproteinase-24 [Nelusetta ayraudi]|uniref:matrix metalloproteinase-24 n=1 Tax=Nelusetta ayraudi TaxID=303726 RepID=UPI003F7261C2